MSPGDGAARCLRGGDISGSAGKRGGIGGGNGQWKRGLAVASMYRWGNGRFPSSESVHGEIGRGREGYTGFVVGVGWGLKG